MNDSACNEAKQKALDEFISRVKSCNNSVSKRANLITEISDRLNGAEPTEGGTGEKQAEPNTIFQDLNNCITDLEYNVKRLESNSDRLNGII